MGGRLIPADVHMHLAQLYSNDKRYANAADELELFLKEASNAKDTDSIKNHQTAAGQKQIEIGQLEPNLECGGLAPL